jgi:hypothetical protein
VVTPLFKKKGSKNDLNNYRGLSVLPPVGKALEKIMFEQMITFINENNILFPSQHGFRQFHSCETALHELISHMFRIKSLRLIAIFLFIDFRKAFDLVNSSLLLHKLQLYGFSEDALNLFANYFSNRHQIVKINNVYSDKCEVKLGVPQGSILGPLLFLLFINDLPHYLSKFKSLLFADDTTLFMEDNDQVELMNRFEIGIQDLLVWTKFNQIDINWDKTEVMFISNKRNFIKPACNSLALVNSNLKLKVVEKFKILGVTVDNKLNFMNYVGDLRKTINGKLFAIHNLFFLPHTVKIQFFKTFILPYFDFCSTIFIYFPKYTLQKICNLYNFCLFKLLRIEFKIVRIEDINLFNNYLSNFNLYTFQHRLLSRILLFSFKLLNYKMFNINLKNELIFNNKLNKGYSLRNENNLAFINSTSLNSFNENTLHYFFTKFINCCCIDIIYLNEKHYKIFIENNINLIFLIFIKNFAKFDVQYKYINE